MSPLNPNDLLRIFESLDKNMDGRVSLDELQWLLERIGVHTNPDDLELLVGKDSLDFNEFSQFYDAMVTKSDQISSTEGQTSTNSNDEEETYLREAFKVFDLNGDGFISPDEIKDVLHRLGMWKENGGIDCMMIVQTYDTNSDGLVDFEEFKQMMLAVQ